MKPEPPLCLRVHRIRRVTLVMVAMAVLAVAAGKLRPPVTRIEVVTDRMHGIDIQDPYRWLEDQQSPETRAWINAQNSYTRAVLDAIPGRDRLRMRLEKLNRVDSQSAPIVRNGRYFFTRQAAEQEQAVIVVREGINGSERVLVDPIKLSPDGSVSVHTRSVTSDGKILAWARRKGGEDEAEIYFLNVENGQLLLDRLPRGVYESVFVIPDKSGFIYSRRRSGEGTRVLEHRFGSTIEDDRELFGAGMSEDRIIWLKFSEDGRFVAAFVNEGAGDDPLSRVYFLDRSTPHGFQPLITDIPANFEGAFGGHTLFLRTTWNAPNRRVLAVDLEKPDRENWRQVIPQAVDSVITDIVPAGHRLLVFFSRNVNTQLVLFAPDGKTVREISLPTLGTGYPLGDTTWDSDEVFFEFESFAHPWMIYRQSLTTAQQSVWDKPNLPIDSDAIATTQVWYTSKDSTRVPMFVVAKKGTEWARNRPTILSAYGSSGAIMTPGFDEKVAMWVADGGIYALANIRGGGEFGEKWHRDGMLEKKQNSFDDFIAAAEWLIANNFTRPAKLGIRGSSSGGLLVATATTQRPDLFRAVVCDSPVLDMLRYHLFGLYAAAWTKETGNPEIREEFEYLRKYSPYHNVHDRERYPAVLFKTGDGDTRVAPMHARKMAARMQSASRSGLPILLRYDLIAGHAGSGSLSNYLDEAVDEMAFLYAQLGLKR